MSSRRTEAPDGPAIRTAGLVKKYDDVTAVAGLDLTIDRGECFGLLGPNGAGKTTTIESLEGLTLPDSGEVEVLGMRWTDEAGGRALREHLGQSIAYARSNGVAPPWSK